MPSKAASPKGAEIRELRETFGISQTEAAEMVYSTLRSWQNWEADEVGMHPAIWAWFKHSVRNAGGATPPELPEDPSHDVKYVRQVISFWWNGKDKSIHVTTQGTEPPLHTTFPRNIGSNRWHESMFNWLRLTLEANRKPAPDEVNISEAKNVIKPTYRGPLEYVVRNVLQLANEHLARTGSPPKPRDTAQVVRDVLPLLPLGSVS
ncbi:MAG: hypothetical protein ACJ8R9_17260 [Steroidobacteraceae bacterium]